MLKYDRQKLIEEELHRYGSILIPEMSAKLECSEETIRRDLKDLESQNKLKRIHGGAYLPDTEDKGVPTYLRETLFSKEKERMASYALQNFIKENDTIMLDCSTTCLALAKQIFLSNIKVTIITNSLRIFNLFERQSSTIKLIAIGGAFHQKSNSFFGYQATKALSNYLADKCFISCPAIDLTHGLIDNNLNESQVRKCYIDHSRQHYLIADHTKFSDTADYIISSLDDIDIIISDKKLSKSWEDTLKNHNLPIHYC